MRIPMTVRDHKPPAVGPEQQHLESQASLDHCVVTFREGVARRQPPELTDGELLGTCSVRLSGRDLFGTPCFSGGRPFPSTDDSPATVMGILPRKPPPTPSWLPGSLGADTPSGPFSVQG